MSWTFYTRTGVGKAGAVTQVAGTGGDADTLDGLDSTAFWKKTDSVNAETLSTHPSTDFYLKTDSIDADELGGLGPSDYWKKTDDLSSGSTSTAYVLKVGDAMTGPLLLTADAPTDPTQATNKAYVDGQLSSYLPLAGGTLTGALSIPNPTVPQNAVNIAYLSANYLSLSGNQTVTGNVSLTATPSSANHLINKSYGDANYIPITGGTMTGRLTLNSSPINTNDAANKFYVDSIASGASTLLATVSANTTLDSSYNVVLVDSSSASVVITLPTTAATGKSYTIKDKLGSANTHAITVSGGGLNIDTVGTYTLDTQFEWVTVIFDGTNWSVIG